MDKGSPGKETRESTKESPKRRRIPLPSYKKRITKLYPATGSFKGISYVQCTASIGISPQRFGVTVARPPIISVDPPEFTTVALVSSRLRGNRDFLGSTSFPKGVSVISKQGLPSFSPQRLPGQRDHAKNFSRAVVQEFCRSPTQL
mmetsp:Transcript_21374/g.31077  ORF Transcript_21374/g.31077 Transcript_21374/m.31077 type:complete len:146 (+) Transcript_21374:1506-1943(+)